jgi:omega-6 fatty acid desaturase (delta-12 desaturase)
LDPELALSDDAHPTAMMTSGETKPLTGKALIAASRRYATEDRARSWWAVFSAIALFAVSTASAVFSKPWPVRAAFATVSGLLLVRLFILYHDFIHGAILRKSRVARAILHSYGVLVMTPPGVWRETHNYHHAHTAKIVGSHVGSYPMVTPRIWAAMSPRAHLLYRAARHPLTMVFGYVTIFMVGMCAVPFFRAPKKNWDAGLALLVNWSMTALLISRFGFGTFLFGYGLPLAIATCTGAYLFYAQHNFPSIRVQPRETWNFTDAALGSSSYMEMGPVMQWFTGNIGYHHVHHLNPSIPFYRLPEAMAGIAELQAPGRTSLAIRDVVGCLRLKMWDPDTGHMTGYPSNAIRGEASGQRTRSTDTESSARP